MERKIVKYRWQFAVSLFSLIVILFLVASSAVAKDTKIAKNIGPLQAFASLESGSGAHLVDVRTPAEYQVIGHPAKAYNIPFMYLSDEFVKKGGMFRGDKVSKTRYQFYENPDFLAYMKAHFKVDDVLYIICRSANRSVPASDLLAANGFKNVYNVLGGFEGGKFYGYGKEEKALMKKYSENYSRRGFFNGWKYYGLPWTYSMNPEYIYEPHKK